ncbi:hypothetical protein NDU88_003982 [Pleurodeles waltl]|uniref:Uncharacterized protein n=1 Tax=Pleurodeles waltl TaxID=8319 RepID=A0AAV7KYK4_PLEWA|nr:hypothetical protein NDU88_003982 [Pleurodeles waltl]
MTPGGFARTLHRLSTQKRHQPSPVDLHPAVRLGGGASTVAAHRFPDRIYVAVRYGDEPILPLTWGLERVYPPPIPVARM